MLTFIAGTNDLDKVSLAEAAEKYLLAGGMTAEQIEKLKTNLTTKYETAP